MSVTRFMLDAMQSCRSDTSKLPGVVLGPREPLVHSAARAVQGRTDEIDGCKPLIL